LGTGRTVYRGKSTGEGGAHSSESEPLFTSQIPKLGSGPSARSLWVCAELAEGSADHRAVVLLAALDALRISGYRPVRPSGEAKLDKAAVEDSPCESCEAFDRHFIAFRHADRGYRGLAWCMSCGHVEEV